MPGQVAFEALLCSNTTHFTPRPHFLLRLKAMASRGWLAERQSRSSSVRICPEDMQKFSGSGKTREQKGNPKGQKDQRLAKCLTGAWQMVTVSHWGPCPVTTCWKTCLLVIDPNLLLARARITFWLVRKSTVQLPSSWLLGLVEVRDGFQISPQPPDC